MGGGRRRTSAQVLLAYCSGPAEGGLHGPVLEQLCCQSESPPETCAERKGKRMNTQACNPMIEDYFAELERRMSDLPAKDRQELTRELRAHVLDRLEQQSAATEVSCYSVLKALGRPEEIA